MHYDLHWHGPMAWYGSGVDVLFEHQLADAAGIYLWTVRYRQGFLTYYVGETGRSFRHRHIDHTGQYLAGIYRVYEPTSFSQGVKHLIWSSSQDQSTLGFLNRFPELAPRIYQFLGLISLFLAPLNVDRRTRRRIEGAIARHLRSQPDPIGTFQDDDIRYARRQDGEGPISLRMLVPATILGLPTELVA